ncbi:MAG: M48 family metallopeptidase [Leptospirales bacterium]
MMEEQKSKYFTGENGLPHEGSLHVFPEYLLFKTNSGEEIQIDYKRIVHVSKISNELHIEISIENVKNNSEKIIVEGIELHDSILKYWSHFHSGIIKKIDHYMHGLSLKKVGIIFGVVFPMAVAIYLTAFFNSYYLIPLSFENSFGDSAYRQLTENFGVCEDKKLNKAVDKILQSIPVGNEYEYSVTILDVDMVNALALPGGRILIFRKLIEVSDTPEELAAVLAHEIGHIEKRHTMQQLVRTAGLHIVISTTIGGFGETLEVIETATEIANLILILNFSRAFESEADEVALNKLAEAGLDPANFTIFFERMKQLEEEMYEEAEIEEDSFLNQLTFLSTHPPTKNRISLTRQFAEDYKGKKWGHIRGIRHWKSLSQQCGSNKPKEDKDDDDDSWF